MTKQGAKLSRLFAYAARLALIHHPDKPAHGIARMVFNNDDYRSLASQCDVAADELAEWVLTARKIPEAASPAGLNKAGGR
jgi:hypothetical protein